MAQAPELTPPSLPSQEEREAETRQLTRLVQTAPTHLNLAHLSPEEARTLVEQVNNLFPGGEEDLARVPEYLEAEKVRYEDLLRSWSTVSTHLSDVLGKEEGRVQETQGILKNLTDRTHQQSVELKKLHQEEHPWMREIRDKVDRLARLEQSRIYLTTLMKAQDLV